MEIAGILSLLVVVPPMLFAYPVAATFCRYFLEHKKQASYWIVLLSACISPPIVLHILVSLQAFFTISFEPFTPHFWKSLASHGMTIGFWLKVWVSTSFVSILPALLAVVIYRRRGKRGETPVT